MDAIGYMEWARDLAILAVREAGGLGCSYSEARLHRLSHVKARLRNGEVEPAIMREEAGIGVRIIYEGALAFGSTNRLDPGSIRALLGDLMRMARSGRGLARRVELSEEAFERARWRVKEGERLIDMGIEAMIEELKDCDRAIRGGFHGIGVKSRLLELWGTVEERYYVNSEGAEVEGYIARPGFSSDIVLKLDGRERGLTVPTGYAHLGGSGGWELIRSWRLHEFLREEVSRLCRHLARAGSPPGGIFDVVLGPSVGAIIAHEACGHPSEADRIMGREAAQAGESYLDRRSIGKRIGSGEANVCDDPTIEGSSGFYLYDDEGVKARRREIFKEGVVNELLHNRETAAEFGIGSNASSRAESYDVEPIVRMANTYIEPGDHEPEELIEGIGEGIYIRSFMEWNIDDRRVNQRYVGLEAYTIEGGRIGREIRDVVLEITSMKLWSSIDARASDLEFTSAFCGKGDPIQSVPVWTGAPHIRLRGVRIGSR